MKISLVFSFSFINVCKFIKIAYICTPIKLPTLFYGHKQNELKLNYRKKSLRKADYKRACIISFERIEKAFF